MKKELQDYVWQKCGLPKEFKEEVKKEWLLTDDADRLPHDAFLRGKYQMMRDLFGLHNLTSDAEGEEMLTVSRKNVQKMYSYNEEELTKDPTNKGALLLKLRLDALFGSKCLPDEGTDCTPVEVGVAENATTSNVDSPEANVDSSHDNVESLKPLGPKANSDYTPSPKSGVRMTQYYFISYVFSGGGFGDCLIDTQSNPSLNGLRTMVNESVHKQYGITGNATILNIQSLSEEEYKQLKGEKE